MSSVWHVDCLGNTFLDIEMIETKEKIKPLLINEIYFHR
jgi:hypothetical protein